MVGDCLDEFSKRLSQEHKAQNNFSEIFVYKVSATRINYILAPCHWATAQYEKKEDRKGGGRLVYEGRNVREAELRFFLFPQGSQV